MFWVFSLITVQALVGGLDNLWHHEITQRLPSRRTAAGELALHAARELVYSFVFIALAWFRWQGYWVMLIAFALVLEIIITLADFVVEDRTRRLPPFERVLHTILALNFGAAVAVLIPVLADWWGMHTGVMAVSHGLFSWIFTFLSAGVLVWSVRNAFAALTLRRPPEWVREPIMAGSRATPRTVLVSGATGFIGGHLVRRLVARGDKLIVFTRHADIALDRFGPQVRIVTSLNDLDINEKIDAVVNLGKPVTHLEFQRGIASALGRPVWLRIPAIVLRATLGEMAQLLVDGQRVVSNRATVLGFRFRYPDVRRALISLLRDPVARRIRREAMMSDAYVRAHRRVTWW